MFFMLLLSSNLVGQQEAEVLSEGIVFPRLTNTEKLTISKKTGQFIYNADDQVLEYVDSGNNWRQIDPYKLKDRDGDTYITPELFTNENIIRMFVAGTEAFRIRKNPQGLAIFEPRSIAGNIVLGGNGNALNLDPSMAKNNLLIGDRAGFALSDGDDNVALGAGAFILNQSGSQNVAVGSLAMQTNPSGDRNIAIGYKSLQKVSDNDNISIGFESMLAATSSSNVIAVGNNALKSYPGFGDDGIIAIGHDALPNLTNGFYNIAIGHKVGENLAQSFGTPNTIIGYKALSKATSAQGNIVIGTLAMENSTADPFSGQGPVGNTVVGDGAMRKSRGQNTVAIGGNALALSEYGTGNVAVGVEAMVGNKTGSRNTALGFGAMQSTDGASRNVAIGDGAAAFYTGFNSVFIGYRAGSGISSGDNQLHIANTGTKSLISGNFSTDEVNINSILNLVPRSVVPVNPQTGTMYMDDGTNTGGVPTLRIYIDATNGWKNI